MCFSLLWLVTLLVQLVIVAGIIMIARRVIPWIFAKLGVDGSILIDVLNIIIWVVVTIMIIWLLYDLVTCLWGMRLTRY